MSQREALRRTLTVIEGGGQPRPAWRELPSPILGRSPFDRSEVAVYRLAQHDITKAWESHRYQPILECWGMVVGQIPPVNSESKLEAILGDRQLKGVANAHACFRGVKRPVADDRHGFDTVVFISKPTVMLTYSQSMSGVFAITNVPEDLVFATYVRLDQPAEGRYRGGNVGDRVVNGVISLWQLLESAANDEMLPIDYGNRYRMQLW